MVAITQGIKAEHIFAERFNGKLITDLSLQYKDIDCQLKDGRYVSIKHLKTGEKTGNFSFEYLLENTRNGNTMAGSIRKCEAELYAIYCGEKWYVFNTKDLILFLDENETRLRKVKTGAWLEEANRKQGRTFDRGWNYLVSIKEVSTIAKWIG